MGPHGEPSSNRKNRATQSSFPKTEPELSYGWRSTAGTVASAPVAPAPPPKTADLSTEPIHSYTSKQAVPLPNV